MSGDEIMVLVAAGFGAVVLVFRLIFSNKDPLYLRNYAAEGYVRLSILFSICWIIYVLYRHADPSVVGIYRLFYIVLGLGVLQYFGIFGSRVTGMRRNIDVLERNNEAAGMIVGAFTLATGMIVGCSNWGEADPSGDGEGGWWIPMGFFLAAWICLHIAARLYRKRETGGVIRRMRQIRDPQQALGFSLYLLSSGWILAESVAGDFYGWKQGLTAVGAIGGMLIVHEAAALLLNRDAHAKPKSMTAIEVVFYIATSAGYTWANHYFLPKWGITL